MYMCMGSVNIAVKKEAYEFLKSLKSDSKSFSDVILEFKGTNKGNIMKFFGVLKDSDIDWKNKKRRMKEFRDSFNSRINETLKYMEETRENDRVR